MQKPAQTQYKRSRDTDGTKQQHVLTLNVTVQPSGKPTALASAMAASTFSSSVFWGFEDLDLGGIVAAIALDEVSQIVEGQTTDAGSRNRKQGVGRC